MVGMAVEVLSEVLLVLAITSILHLSVDLECEGTPEEALLEWQVTHPDNAYAVANSPKAAYARQVTHGGSCGQAPYLQFTGKDIVCKMECMHQVLNRTSAQMAGAMPTSPLQVPSCATSPLEAPSSTCVVIFSSVFLCFFATQTSFAWSRALASRFLVFWQLHL
jgi:hypothetical protein